MKYLVFSGTSTEGVFSVYSADETGRLIDSIHDDELADTSKMAAYKDGKLGVGASGRFYVSGQPETLNGAGYPGPDLHN